MLNKPKPDLTKQSDQKSTSSSEIDWEAVLRKVVRRRRAERAVKQKPYPDARQMETLENQLKQKPKRKPLKQPVLVAVILLCAVTNLDARNYHAEVRPVSVLLISAGDTEPTLSPGHALTFVLVIENRGNSAATDVRLSSSSTIQSAVPERPQAYSQSIGPFPFEIGEKTSTLPAMEMLSDSEVQNLKTGDSRVYVWTEATWKDPTGPRREAFCNWLELKVDSHGVIRKVKLQECGK